MQRDDPTGHRPAGSASAAPGSGPDAVLAALAHRLRARSERQQLLTERLRSGELRPGALADLAELAAAARRGVRDGDHILVMAGAPVPERGGGGALPLGQVLSAAVAASEAASRTVVPPTPSVLLDPAAGPVFGQILAELLAHATAATSPGERLELHTRWGPDGGLVLELLSPRPVPTRTPVDELDRMLGAGRPDGPVAPQEIGLYLAARLARSIGGRLGVRGSGGPVPGSSPVAVLYLPQSVLGGGRPAGEGGSSDPSSDALAADGGPDPSMPGTAASGMSVPGMDPASPPSAPGSLPSVPAADAESSVPPWPPLPPADAVPMNGVAHNPGAPNGPGPSGEPADAPSGSGPVARLPVPPPPSGPGMPGVPPSGPGGPFGNGPAGAGPAGNGLPGGNGFPGNAPTGNGFPGNAPTGNGLAAHGPAGNGLPGNGPGGNPAAGNPSFGNGLPAAGPPGNGLPGAGASGNGLPGAASGNGHPGTGAPGGPSGNGLPGTGVPGGNGLPGTGVPGANGLLGGGVPGGTGLPGGGLPGATGLPGGGAPGGNGLPGTGPSGNGHHGNPQAGNGPPGNGHPGGSPSADGLPGNGPWGAGMPGNGLAPSGNGMHPGAGPPSVPSANVNPPSVPSLPPSGDGKPPGPLPVRGGPRNPVPPPGGDIPSVTEAMPVPGTTPPVELFGPFDSEAPVPLDDMDGTPIFAAVASAWFRDPVPGPGGAPAEPAPPPPSNGRRPDEPANWTSPGDAEFDAARSRANRVVEPPATVNGLPMRRPGQQMVPPSRREVPEAAPRGPSAPERQPERVRNRLASYQRGLREGRHRAAEEHGAQAAPTPGRVNGSGVNGHPAG